jgi:hypothetical protein
MRSWPHRVFGLLLIELGLGVHADPVGNDVQFAFPSGFRPEGRTAPTPMIDLRVAGMCTLTREYLNRTPAVDVSAFAVERFAKAFERTELNIV